MFLGQTMHLFRSLFKYIEIYIVMIEIMKQTHNSLTSSRRFRGSCLDTYNTSKLHLMFPCVDRYKSSYLLMEHPFRRFIVHLF